MIRRTGARVSRDPSPGADGNVQNTSQSSTETCTTPQVQQTDGQHLAIPVVRTEGSNQLSSDASSDSSSRFAETDGSGMSFFSLVAEPGCGALISDPASSRSSSTSSDEPISSESCPIRQLAQLDVLPPSALIDSFLASQYVVGDRTASDFSFAGQVAESFVGDGEIELNPGIPELNQPILPDPISEDDLGFMNFQS
jgi:hypothetical protein